MGLSKDGNTSTCDICGKDARYGSRRFINTFKRLIYLCDPCTVALYEARAEWLRERGVS